jgi:predicted nucleotidyltransferase
MSDSTPSMDISVELKSLVQALNDAGVQFAVCGGLCLIIHGFVRATMDIDLLIPSDQIEKALEVAKAVGFWIPSGRMPFKPNSPQQMEIWRVSKAKGPDLLPLDLIIVTPVLEAVWESRISVEFDGITCPIVSREGLIAMKRLAGRRQDLVDIERLQSGE